MIDFRFHSHRSIMLLLSALCITLSFSSCSDDDSPFQDKDMSNGQKEIVFSVSTSSDWNNGTRTHTSPSVTRSSSSDDYLPTVTLTSSYKSNLYLIPEVRDGIDLSSKYSEAALKSSETTRKYSAPTRSSLTTNETIGSFGVFASLHPNNSSSDAFKPDYMYNVEVTKTDDNSWAPKAEYLWPNEATLHINAYSPYSSTETLNSSEKALNNSEGITSLPSADETGNLSISWVTPSDVANQQDLLWAVPKDASASPCDLTFNHALTAIRFVTGSEMIPCTIKKIEITNVLSSGSLNIETGEWTPNDAIESYSVTPNIALEAVAGEAYVAAGTAITSDAETFLLLPQTLTGNSEIILTIESNGTESNFNASLENQIWTAGKTVIYRLSANPV
ncbi:MAG: fimbrillin family protein [Muribaculaceae bacterium]|nr:fimbrillin family protein [Muribaculaceae bacterium]